LKTINSKILYTKNSVANFILEDNSHAYDSTKNAWTYATNIMADNGVMISHDVCNHFGTDVLRAIRDCGIEPLIVQLEDDAPGFALWQKKPTQPESEPTVTAKPKPTSRRKRRASKATS
jgi:hypothetical protein